MALRITVNPGKTFSPGELLTEAKLNQLGLPSVAAEIEDYTVTKDKLSRDLQELLFNVMDFGAVGNGETDDTAAFQQAVDAASEAGGGVIRVSRGTYILSRVVNGVDPENLYAVKVIDSNIWFQGEGEGISILKQGTVETTMIHFAGGGIHNIGLRGLTFERWGIGGYPDPAKFSNATAGTGAFVSFAGTEAAPAKGVSVFNCEFHNVVTVGVLLAWIKGVRIAHNRFEYFDGFSDTTDHQWGPVAAIFNGAPRVWDVSIVGNTFNGNVSGTNSSHKGMENAVWLSKGGNYSIVGNTIRNYFLEAIQTIGAPATVVGNTITTVVGGAAASAWMAFVDTQQSGWIESPNYVFCNNVVVGNGTSHGVILKPGYGAGFPYNAVLKGNIFRGVNTVVFATNATLLTIADNQVQTCSNFFNNTNYPNGANCKVVSITDNVVLGCTEYCVLCNSPVDGMIRVSGNILSGGVCHGFFYPGGYYIDWRDNNCVDNSGKEIAESIILDASAASMVPSGATYGEDGTYQVAAIPAGALATFVPGANETQLQIGTRVWSAAADFVSEAGTGVLTGTPSTAVTAIIKYQARIARKFGRDFLQDRPVESRAFGYRVGDRIWNSNPMNGKALSWDAWMEQTGGATVVPNFGDRQPHWWWNWTAPATIGTAWEVMAHIPGQSIRVLDVKVVMMGNTAWSGGSLEKILVRHTGAFGSSPNAIIAEIPMAALASGPTVDPSGITFKVSNANMEGGLGGFNNYDRAAVEVVGVDSGGVACNGLLGSPILVAVLGVYEYTQQ